MPVVLEKSFLEKFEIRHLEKEKFTGFILEMDYETSLFYDVVLDNDEKEKWNVSFERIKLEKPICHTSEEYNFPDKLYQDCYQNAFAWGIFEKGNLDSPIAVVEIDLERWSNRLRVTEMWVHKDFRRQGLATILMNIVKDQGRLSKNRAIILETQSCNVGAIDFYRSCGFKLVGFDSCCYHNGDIKRKEVRIEMGFFFEEKKNRLKEILKSTEITIIAEDKDKEKESEYVCRRSFYNKYKIGCNEHLFLHELRKSDLYLPEFSRVALLDNKIVGGIWYTKSYLEHNGAKIPLVTFGPLCVDPEYQGVGIGELLIKETLLLVKKSGYPGVIIYGEPDYYPRVGFKTCDKFGITTSDGQNFDAFMGLEFEKGSLSQYAGSKFYEIDIEDQLSEEAVNQFDVDFPPLAKYKRPGQWK
jgi:predicted N-acetyltransferase YhbS